MAAVCLGAALLLLGAAPRALRPEEETKECFRENKGLISITKPVNGGARILSVMPYK